MRLLNKQKQVTVLVSYLLYWTSVLRQSSMPHPPLPMLINLQIGDVTCDTYRHFGL